jgi:transposase-like protein
MSYYDAPSAAPHRPAVAVSPAAQCPFCQSRTIETTDAVVTAASYFRCLGCGEVWNPSRELVRRPPPRRW